jgi:hypothetical protein
MSRIDKEKKTEEAMNAQLFCGKISMEEIFGDSRYVGGYVYCLHM